MVDWLLGRGVPADVAAVVADSSGGNPERARVMTEDPDVAARAALWSSVPDRLNDTGVVAAELARSLLASAERATEPLRAAHARELERLTEEAAEFGEKGLPGRKEITDRHQREERRWRTDALRAGLGALARAYRDRMTATGRRGDAGAQVHAQAAAEAVRLITEVARALPRNPQESLLLQSLLVRPRRPLGLTTGTAGPDPPAGTPTMNPLRQGRIPPAGGRSDWPKRCLGSSVGRAAHS